MYGFPCVHQQSSRYTESEGKASARLAEPEIIVLWLVILLVVGRSLLQMSTEVYVGLLSPPKQCWDKFVSTSATKAYRWSGGRDPLINLRTRWR